MCVCVCVQGRLSYRAIELLQQKRKAKRTGCRKKVCVGLRMDLAKEDLAAELAFSRTSVRIATPRIKVARALCEGFGKLMRSNGLSTCILALVRVMKQDGHFENANQERERKREREREKQLERTAFAGKRPWYGGVYVRYLPLDGIWSPIVIQPTPPSLSLSPALPRSARASRSEIHTYVYAILSRCSYTPSHSHSRPIPLALPRLSPSSPSASTAAPPVHARANVAPTSATAATLHETPYAHAIRPALQTSCRSPLSDRPRRSPPRPSRLSFGAPLPAPHLPVHP
jgi:hypothetical protein